VRYRHRQSGVQGLKTAVGFLVGAGIAVGAYFAEKYLLWLALMAVIWNPAAVKAPVIACSGRSQRLRRAGRPLKLYSSVRLEVAK
jgi:hypothetical protein